VRILFDQGTPAPLRHALVGHSVETAFELGWGTLQNGALISAAEEQGFEVFVTTQEPAVPTESHRPPLGHRCLVHYKLAADPGSRREGA